MTTFLVWLYGENWHFKLLIMTLPKGFNCRQLLLTHGVYATKCVMQINITSTQLIHSKHSCSMLE